MFGERFKELAAVCGTCQFTTQRGLIQPEEALSSAHFLLTQVERVNGIVYVIGNGGSAGIASHFCTDLLRTLDIPAATLFDPAVLTCFSNDFGYPHVFALPLTRNLRANDLLVAISSSGQSPNIVNAAQSAKEKKVPIVSLTGFEKDNPLRSLGDLNFWIDSSDYGLVEMGHFFLLHTIVDTCKKKSKTSMPSARS